jgi:hypothetical protein
VTPFKHATWGCQVLSPEAFSPKVLLASRTRASNAARIRPRALNGWWDEASELSGPRVDGDDQPGPTSSARPLPRPSELPAAPASRLGFEHGLELLKLAPDPGQNDHIMGTWPIMIWQIP